MRGETFFWPVNRELLKKALHVFFASSSRLIPAEAVRLSGGFAPLSWLVILLRGTALAFLAILFSRLLVYASVQIVALLKLPEVFRLEMVQPAVITAYGGTLEKGLLCAVLLISVYRLLRSITSGLYVSPREILFLSRSILQADLIRIPLPRVDHVSFRQFPGERLFRTGTMEIAWMGAVIEIPAVPRIERACAEISDALQSL